MNEILSACGAFVFVYVLKLHTTFKILNRKPFACEVCMGGWFALLLNINTYWLQIPFRMAAAMVLTILITALLKRL